MSAFERLKEMFGQLTIKHNALVKRENDRHEELDKRIKRLERSPWQKLKDYFNGYWGEK